MTMFGDPSKRPPTLAEAIESAMRRGTPRLDEMKFPFKSEDLEKASMRQADYSAHYGSQSQARYWLSLATGFSRMHSGTTVFLTAADIDALALNREPGL